MKRLPDNFSQVLESIDRVLKLESGIDYSKMNRIYKKVDKILKQNECLIPDVDKMLHEYKLKNKTVSRMRKLCKKRNRHIYTMCKSSSKLRKLSRSLAKELSSKFEGTVKPVYVENAVKKLIRKRSNGWCGCWSVVKVDDSSGKVKDISLFDTDDKRFVIREVRKQMKS